VSDREDEAGRDREGWYPHPGEWFPPPIVSPLPEPEPEAKVGRALLAGTAAAILGGIGWGLVVKWTGYEAGIVALAVGLLAAFAVHVAAGRRCHGAGRDRDRQVPRLRVRGA
jgi:hypothetical protein